MVDAAVPLVPPKVSTVQLPREGSAAQIAQSLLGDGVKVVSAFHNVGASKLHQGDRADCDVLVFSNDKEARELVMALAGLVATRGIDGGVLANSAAAEALTSVLIGINRKYKVPGAGIRITGLPTPPRDCAPWSRASAILPSPEFRASSPATTSPASSSMPLKAAGLAARKWRHRRHRAKGRLQGGRTLRLISRTSFRRVRLGNSPIDRKGRAICRDRAVGIR